MTRSSQRAACVRLQLLLIPAILILHGCGMFDTLPFEHLAMPKPDRTHLEEGKYRERFQSTQDPAAMRWLMAYRIENGMTRGEVEAVIGQSGDYEPSDRLLKASSRAYLSSDKAYKFGPDNKGQSYYFMFRDDKLIGFNPKEFKDEFKDESHAWEEAEGSNY